jgi:hypothetical protein
MAQWYCNSNGQQSGPMETAELKQLAASGRLQPGDLVWREGMAQWAAASTVKGLLPESGEIPLAAAPAVAGADYQCSTCGGMFNVDNVYDNGGGTFICKRCHAQRQQPAGAYAPAYGAGTPTGLNYGYPQPAYTGLIIGGYACAAASLIFCPIGFGIGGVSIGITLINKGKKGNGIAIIVLSAVFALLSMVIGATVAMSHLNHR